MDNNQNNQHNPEASRSATVTTVGMLTVDEQTQLDALLAKRGPAPDPIARESVVAGNDPIHASRVNPANAMDRQGEREHTLEDELAMLHSSGNVHIAALLRQFVAIRDKWYPLG